MRSSLALIGRNHISAPVPAKYGNLSLLVLRRKLSGSTAARSDPCGLALPKPNTEVFLAKAACVSVGSWISEAKVVRTAKARPAPQSRTVTRTRLERPHRASCSPFAPVMTHAFGEIPRYHAGIIGLRKTWHSSLARGDVPEHRATHLPSGQHSPATPARAGL
jgi:hypothetical protein